jgi:hypothetical protein
MPNVCAQVTYDGFTVFSNGLARDPAMGHVVALSLLGTSTAIRAVLAGLKLEKPVTFRDPEHNLVLLWDKKAEYETLSAPLPENGGQQTIFFQMGATVYGVSDEEDGSSKSSDLYVLGSFGQAGLPGAKSEAEAIRLFAYRFKKMLAVPTLDHWFPYLWREGERARLILSANGHLVPSGGLVPSVGYQTWKIKPKQSEWLKIVERGIAAGELN